MTITTLPELPIEQHISFTTGSMRTAVYKTYAFDQCSDVIDRYSINEETICYLSDRDLWLEYEGAELYRQIAGRIDAEAGW